jgi:hypothetical protein
VPVPVERRSSREPELQSKAKARRRPGLAGDDTAGIVVPNSQAGEFTDFASRALAFGLPSRHVLAWPRFCPVDRAPRSAPRPTFRVCQTAAWQIARHGRRCRFRRCRALGCVLSRLCVALTVVLSGVMLLGWELGSELLEGLVMGLVPMRFSFALGLLLACVASACRRGAGTVPAGCLAGLSGRRRAFRDHRFL